MSRKAFHITVDFNIHSVTCPGVWLCPKGVVMLRIAMFGLSENTRSIKPCFPLLFHETFRFSKLLKDVNSLACLQEVLNCRNLHIQLVHLANGPSCCPATILATFKSPLADVFYPGPSNRGLNVGVDVDLLLNPMPCFPGIISPKVEVSTRVSIEEKINYPVLQDDTWIVNPVTIISKKSFNEKMKTSEDSNQTKQRTVCHSEGIGEDSSFDTHVCNCYRRKYKHKCSCYNYCTGNNNEEKQSKPPFIAGKYKRNDKPGSMHEKSRKGGQLIRSKLRGVKYCDLKSKVQSRTQKSDIKACSCFTLKKSDGVSICDCILCQKYNDYFHEKDDNNSADNDSEKNTKKSISDNKKKCEKCSQEMKSSFKPTLAKPLIKQIPTGPSKNFQNG